MNEAFSVCQVLGSVQMGKIKSGSNKKNLLHHDFNAIA